MNDLFERHLRTVRHIGSGRERPQDSALYERFMVEFHELFPNATCDEYARFKHTAAAAAGVLVEYGEK